MTITLKKNYDSISDEQLLRGTARGDDRLYAELMRRYMRAVYTFVLQHVGPEEAIVITEKTFYTFWKSSGRFAKEEKYRRQLFSIAHSLVNGHQKQAYILPSRTIRLPAGYAIRIQKITLLELSDRLRRPLALVKVAEASVRAYLLSSLTVVQRTFNERFRYLLANQSRV